jgi:hypothetical protein
VKLRGRIKDYFYFLFNIFWKLTGRGASDTFGSAQIRFQIEQELNYKRAIKKTPKDPDFNKVLF